MSPSSLSNQSHEETSTIREYTVEGTFENEEAAFQDEAGIRPEDSVGLENTSEDVDFESKLEDSNETIDAAPQQYNAVTPASAPAPPLAGAPAPILLAEVPPAVAPTASPAVAPTASLADTSVGSRARRPRVSQRELNNLRSTLDGTYWTS